MIEILATPFVLMINSLLSGIFTKFADLTDEHGLKVPKGINILLGILWGGFISLIFIGNFLLGTFYLAILFHWILRNKIDYLNHGIAAIIILVTFIWLIPNNYFNWIFFLIIFLVYSVFGLLIDYKKIGKGWFTKFNISGFIILGIFLFLDKVYWIVLVSYLLNTFGYQIVKFKFER